MTRPDVVVYGLCIRSEIPVRGLPAGPGRSPDLEIVAGSDREATSEHPAGDLLAEEVLSDTQWYRFVRQRSGDYVLRYTPVCDFLVSADLHRVVVHPVEGIDPDLVSVLASGGLLAFVLMMRGEPVLHASAVDVGDRVLAFVGRSGMGKSTMAAICCAEGARLVTDDVLRLDLTGDGPPRCYLGAGELRLRRSSVELGRRFEDPPGRRRTGDGRDALAPAPATSERLPLAGIVIPLPDRTATRLSLDRLDHMEALFSLLAFPRLTGWADPTSQADQFQQLGRLVERTPVYTARVPWGPPFPDGLGAAIMEVIDADQSARST